MSPEIREWEPREAIASDDVRALLDHDLEMIGQARSQAKSLCHRFDNVKKLIIAQEMKKAASFGFEKVSEQEREAHASDAFKGWIEDSAAAVLEYEMADWQYWRIKNTIELFLNEQANVRAQMKIW